MIEVPNTTVSTPDSGQSAVNSKRMRGSSRNYYFSKVFDSLEEAIKDVQDEKVWSIKNRKPNTIYYRCNLQPARKKPACSAAVCIRKHTTNNKASIFRTMCKLKFE